MFSQPRPPMDAGPIQVRTHMPPKYGISHSACFQSRAPSPPLKSRYSSKPATRIANRKLTVKKPVQNRMKLEAMKASGVITQAHQDRKSTRLNSSHHSISYA